MDQKTVTIRYNGTAILIDADVTKAHSLSENDAIKTKKELWQILADNCKLGIMKCKLAIDLTKNVCKN